jgi:hypothetical protein
VGKIKHGGLRISRNIMRTKRCRVVRMPVSVAILNKQEM